jgi:hypothetical protein
LVEVCYEKARSTICSVSLGDEISVYLESLLTVTGGLGVDLGLVLVLYGREDHGLHGHAGLVKVVSVGLLGAFCCTHFILEILKESLHF